MKNIVYSATIGVIAVVPFIFNILIKGGYKESYLYIPILVFSVYFSNMASFYGGIFSAYKRTKIIGTTTLISAVINLVINLIFIKFIGIYAAAISTLVSSIFLYVYRKYKIKKLANFVHSKDLIISALITIVVFISYYSNNTVFQIMALIFAVIYALLMNKDIVRMVTNKIKIKK